MLYKEVRLRALQDSPSAFGSTYARESQLSNQEWIERATRSNGVRAIVYLAMEEGEPCGIAAGFPDEADPGKVHLVSMWVAPAHRRKGVGRMLIDAVQSWAKSCRAHTLQLMVTSSNSSAIKFYEQMGFSVTGNTAPYPNDPALIEFEMSHLLADIKSS